MIAILIGLVVIAGIVGGVWYFMFREEEGQPIEIKTETKTGNVPPTCANNEKYDETTKKCIAKGVKCQYIKVLNGNNADNNPETNFLNFAELEAIDENGTNVALKKPTKQSNLYIDGRDLSPNGVDGDYNQTMHTPNGPNEWWQVDLGAEHTITQINFYHRKDCCQYRDNNAKIQLIATDGKTVVHEVIVTEFKDNKQLINYDLTV